MASTGALFEASLTIVDTDELTSTYTTPSDGVDHIDRSKIVMYQGEQRTADEHGLNMLLAVCSGELERGDHEDRPKLHSQASAAMKTKAKEGEEDDEEERAMDAVVQATIRYNWRCTDHNGMRMTSDKQRLLLASAIPPFRAPRSGDFELDPRSRMEATSPQGVKRARELEGSAAASAAGTESMTAPSTAGEPERHREDLTNTDNRKKFKAAFAVFTAHCSDFGDARYFRDYDIANKVLHAHQMLKTLAESTKHSTLQQERKTIEMLEYGVREAIRMKKPVTGALFVAGELEDKLVDEGGFDKKAVHATLKDLKNSYGAKHGEQEYRGWQLQAVPLAGPESFQGAGRGGGGYGYQSGAPPFQHGFPAYQSRTQSSGGGGGASGHYSPNLAPAGRGGGFQRGRGTMGRGSRGGRGFKPVCGSCSRKGLAADHSHRTCPHTTCHHCHQTGHIKINCPN